MQQRERVVDLTEGWAGCLERVDVLSGRRSGPRSDVRCARGPRRSASRVLRHREADSLQRVSMLSGVYLPPMLQLSPRSPRSRGYS